MTLVGRGAIALTLLAAACSSTPHAVRPEAGSSSTPAALAMKVDGQVVGSGIRELVVSLRNDSATPDEINLQISYPQRLALPDAMLTGTMLCEARTNDHQDGQVSYGCREGTVAPGGRSVARFPIVNALGDVSLSGWLGSAPERKVEEIRSLSLTR